MASTKVLEGSANESPESPPSCVKSCPLSTCPPPVTDMLDPENEILDIRQVILIMWKHRANRPFTTDLWQRVCLLPLTPQLLDQVEFYLPQVAHLIVYLEPDVVPMEHIEQFVLLLAQSSVHFALQFFWMIYAAFDENRPKRGGNHPPTFARCARLLLALEQTFVYGSPAACHVSDLLTRERISKDEMKEILMADRRYFAIQQSAIETSNCGNEGQAFAPITGGWLLKKGGGTRTIGRRNWTRRWCRVEKRILLVFSKPTDLEPRAAISLHGAKVQIMEHKRPYYFELTHEFSETKAKFAAQSAEAFADWLACLQKTAALPDPPIGSPSKGLSSTLASMSLTMRTFILQSSLSIEKDSGSKSESITRLGEICLSDSVTEKRTRMLSSSAASASACSTQVGDTEVSQCSITECFDTLMPTRLVPDQHRRYEFFCSMIHFVKGITDVSEALRRMEPPKRKEMLPSLLKQLHIPPRAYIPLCKSTDPYANVVLVFHEEGHVFNTHERAPCLIYFGTIENKSGHDVSTVLFNELYETRTGTVETSQKEDPFDQHAADISVRHREPNRSDSTQSSRRSSPFLRKLLADDDRKKRLEQTFGELSFTKAARLQAANTCDNLCSWQLTGLVSKSFDDLRQEVLVMQLISYFQEIFDTEKLPLQLHPYRILSTGSSTGLIEVVGNAMSLDGIKKTPGFKNLRHHFEQMYAGRTEEETEELLGQAKRNFIHSLAAYSIVCYILSIKDRHNGNIMLDIEGFLIHIDFGFFLGRAPGGTFSFETAPFKLTAEMVDVLGGRSSSNFKYFTDLCVQGALAARKHAETIYTLVEIMSYHSKLPCFIGGAIGPLAGLKDRLFLNMPETKVTATIQNMVQRAYDHFGTNKYDQFQVFSNRIAK